MDVSAPQVIVESFIHNFKLGNTPLILVTSDCGTNDRKKELAMRIIEESGPTVITGRLGDIYAISQVLVEKGTILVVFSTASYVILLSLQAQITVLVRITFTVRYHRSQFLQHPVAMTVTMKVMVPRKLAQPNPRPHPNLFCHRQILTTPTFLRLLEDLRIGKVLGQILCPLVPPRVLIAVPVPALVVAPPAAPCRLKAFGSF